MHNEQKNTATLTQDHLDILAARAIPPEYAAKVALQSVDLAEVKRHIEKYRSPNPYPHLPLYQTTGILISYPEWGDIPGHRVRADRTEVTVPGPVDGAEAHGAKTLKIPRYICQAKPAPVRPFITPEAREVANDTSVPIALVESPLKAFAYCAHIGPAIGFGGVLAGGHDVSALREYEEISIHPELRSIRWKNRMTPIVFDAGIVDNPMVALGAAYAAVGVSKQGGQVHFVTIPPLEIADTDLDRGILYRVEDQGPDDYIAREGHQALRNRLGEMKPADPVQRVRQILDHATGVERAMALGRMFEELPVRAMLYADSGILRTTAELLRAARASVTLACDAVKEFRQSLARRVAKDEVADARVVVSLSTDEEKVNDEVVAALIGDDALYQRDHCLVTVAHEPPATPGVAPTLKREPGTPKITILPSISVRERITRMVRLVKHTNEGDVPAHPPDWMAPMIHARGHWRGIRPLSGVSEAPTMRPDGSILQTPGYDPQTGLLYLPSIEFPPVPDEPTREQAEMALLELREIFADYTFAKPMHESAAVAALMTPTARASVAGSVPVVAVDANKRGIGKTKLADVASLVATGRKAPRLAFTRDDSEVKKQLTSIVVAGDSIILVDNVPGQFGSPVWDEFVTAARWQDRILGTMTMVDRPVQATVFVTGNHIEPLGDIARRTLHVLLHTDLERPDTRPPSHFKHPDLEQHVQGNRARLVIAILTILRAYLVGGAPEVQGAVWGSFESWADRIAKPLVWLGMADPCETRTDFENAPSSHTTRAAALLGAWRRAYGDASRTVGDMVRETAAEAKKDDDADTDLLALRDAVAAFVPATAGEFPSTVSIGKRILVHRRNGRRRVANRRSREARRHDSLAGGAGPDSRSGRTRAGRHDGPRDARSGPQLLAGAECRNVEK